MAVSTEPDLRYCVTGMAVQNRPEYSGAGFDCGTSITAKCEEGKLIITPREEVSYIDVFEEERYACKVEEKGRN